MNYKSLFFFLILSQFSFGQKLPIQNLLEDLTFLNEAVVNGHPVNYNPQKNCNILSIIDKVRQIKTDSISPWVYTIWIEKGIYNIGCSHTMIKKNALLLGKQKFSFLPLTVCNQNNKLLITSCEDSSQIGQKIEQINGVNSIEFVNAYSEFKASDGKTSALSQEYFHLASSKLISNYLNNPDLYVIKTANTVFDFKGILEVYLNKKQTPNILANNGNSFYIINDFAVLQINSFKKNDKRYFKNIFEKLYNTQKEKLIIDLRQNSGGNIKAAAQLTKYLVDTLFSYSVLQPQLSTKDYLNKKGKSYFFLSKLKYNIGNFYRKHKTARGNEFRYQFKPSKNHHFKGKIYVLMDGYTASSATMVTTWLKKHTDALFIGNQTCGGYNGNNGGSFPLITLPNSKIEIQFPAYRLILDRNSDDNKGMYPQILINTNADISAIIKIILEKQNECL